jgi:hypothetical protein
VRVCVCEIMKKVYVPLMFLRGCREAGLCVNARKDNLEIDIKEIALMITRTELILINIQH